MRRFADEYLIDCNGARAYRAVYPKVKTMKAASVGAYRLLKREDVAAYVNERREKRQQKVELKQEDVLRGFMGIAFAPETEPVTIRDRLRALESLGRHAGLFARQKDELDRAEQQARIDRMRAAARAEAEGRTVTVQFIDTEEGEM